MSEFIINERVDRLVETVIMGWAVTAPAWAIVVFAAYAIGRRQFSLLMLIAFTTTEAILLGVAIAALGTLTIRP